MKTKLMLAMILAASFSAQSATHASWSYEGDNAPEHWGELSPDYHLCLSGQNQTPINISGVLHSNLHELLVDYTPESESIVNNGHTVQVNVEQGDYITLDQEKFMLQQFHFHSPSENEIEGHRYPMEIHFVHSNKAGELAVVAVMVEEGAENATLATLLKQAPTALNKTEALKNGIDVLSLLPEDRHFYRFTGSLTTPPCSEGVRWIVMKKPVQASAAQIKQFKALLRHDNNRPLQPLHGRVIVD